MSRERIKRLEIKLNEVEEKKLKDDCKKSNLSKSEYIRRLIMKKKIREKPDEKFYDVIYQLLKIGNNLNQIAYKANYLNDIDKDFYLNESRKWNNLLYDIRKKYL